MIDLETRARRAADEALRMPRDLDAGLADLYRTRRRRALGKAAAASMAIVLAAAGVLVGQTITHRPQPTSPVPTWVIPVPNGHPAGEGAGFGSVWLTVSWRRQFSHVPGYVDRYDPATRRLVKSVQVGADPQAAEPGFGSMWVSNYSDGTVTRIDPTNNAVLATIPVGPGPGQMAASGGGMWVETKNAVVKIDPTTNTVVATADPAHYGADALLHVTGLDANADGVWVDTGYGTVVRLRPSDGRVLATIPVQPAANSEAGQVQVEGDNVWVSSYRLGGGSGLRTWNTKDRQYHLTEISATTNKVIARVPTGGHLARSFLAQQGTVFIVVCGGPAFRPCQLIRTDSPYQVETYAHPLLVTQLLEAGGRSLDTQVASSTTFVDTQGSLWIPDQVYPRVLILHDSNGRAP